MGTPLFYYFIADYGDGSMGLCSYATREQAEAAFKQQEEDLGYTVSEGVSPFFTSDIAH